MPMKKYNSYKFRNESSRDAEYKAALSETESYLMQTLMDFGESIDSQGFDGGDYDVAMEKLLSLIKRTENDATVRKV